MELEINITQAEVFLEVSKQTDYIGTKMTGDEDARDRIATTDADTVLLRSYWTEAVDELVGKCGRLAVNQPAPDADTFTLRLSMPSNWDSAKAANLQSMMARYIAKYIIQAWDKLSNKKEAEAHNKDALTLLEGINFLLHATRRPTRNVGWVTDEDEIL